MGIFFDIINKTGKEKMDMSEPLNNNNTLKKHF